MRRAPADWNVMCHDPGRRADHKVAACGTRGLAEVMALRLNREALRRYRRGFAPLYYVERREHCSAR